MRIERPKWERIRVLRLSVRLELRRMLDASHAAITVESKPYNEYDATTCPMMLQAKAGHEKRAASCR